MELAIEGAVLPSLDFRTLALEYPPIFDLELGLGNTAVWNAEALSSGCISSAYSVLYSLCSTHGFWARLLLVELSLLFYLLALSSVCIRSPSYVLHSFCSLCTLCYFYSLSSLLSRCSQCPLSLLFSRKPSLPLSDLALDGWLLSLDLPFVYYLPSS
jgi:hypothetical protein